MFDNKFLITLIGMIVAVVAINHIKDKDDEIKEDFLGNLPSMVFSAMPVQQQNVQRALSDGKTKTENYELGIKFGAAYQNAASSGSQEEAQALLNPQSCGQNSLAAYATAQRDLNPYADQEKYNMQPSNPLHRREDYDYNRGQFAKNRKQQFVNNGQQQFVNNRGQQFVNRGERVQHRGENIVPNKQIVQASQIRDHRKSVNNNVTNENYVSYPSFQSNISPRFSSLDYGANIRYNFPSVENQGVPLDPLSMGKIVSEEVQEDFPVTCGVGGNNEGQILSGRQDHYDEREEKRRRRKERRIIEENKEDYVGSNYNDLVGDYKSSLAGSTGNVPKPGYSSGNHFSVEQQARDNKVEKVNSIMPIGDMTQQNAAHAQDGTEQPVVYDRYIFSNRDSRIRSQGDWIRGDLPIVPNKNCWFQTSQSSDPFRVLNLGAMNVMRSSEDMDKLASFVTSLTGGANDIVAGVRLSKKELDSADDVAHALMTAQSANTVDPGNGIQVTAFP